MMTQQILNRDPKHELLKAFRLLDDYGTDKIFIKSLKCVAKEFGERMTDVELQEMIISKWISELSLVTTPSRELEREIQESWNAGVTSSSRRWTKRRRVRDAFAGVRGSLLRPTPRSR